MTAHEYAQNLALEGVPLNAISRATGLSMQDITYLRPRERRSYVPGAPLKQIPIQVTVAPEKPPEPVVYKPVPEKHSAKVFRQACDEQGVTMLAVKKQLRKRKIAWPRQAVMFALFTRCPQLSTPGIGRMLGGRDHTTVLHGIQAHGKRLGLSYDEIFAMRVAKAVEMGVRAPIKNGGREPYSVRKARLAAEGRV